MANKCRKPRLATKFDHKATSSVILDTQDQTDNIGQTKLERYICELDALGKPFPTIHGRRILDRNTYRRLKNEATVVTAEDRCMAHKLNVLDRERLQDEKEARRTELQKYGIFHTKGAKLDTVK